MPYQSHKSHGLVHALQLGFFSAVTRLDRWEILRVQMCLEAPLNSRPDDAKINYALVEVEWSHQKLIGSLYVPLPFQDAVELD